MEAFLDVGVEPPPPPDLRGSENLRHNRSFANPHGIPGSEFPVACGHVVLERPWMSGCNYYDMMKESVYKAGSYDFDRLKQYMEVHRHQQEADLRDWSATRFAKQRSNAEFWAGMEPTFRKLRGQSPLPSSESTPTPSQGSGENRQANSVGKLPQVPLSGGGQIDHEGPRPGLSGLTRTPSTSSRSRSAAGGAGPRGAAYMPTKSSSMPSLAAQEKIPYICAGKLIPEGGRGCKRTAVGLAQPGDFVPFKQGIVRINKNPRGPPGKKL